MSESGPGEEAPPTEGVPATEAPPRTEALATTAEPLPAGDRPLAEDLPPPRVRRFWSARRVPAAFAALAVAVAAGALLYDVAAVRADREAMAWRVRVARELADRRLDDIWVTVGAVATAVLGLWLIALAVTPGEREVLPMRRSPGGVRAGLDRRAAALVLRDLAMEVPGVRSARVVVGRRRIRARAGAHFREPEQVRADLESALGEGVARLALSRRPRLTVRVRSGEAVQARSDATIPARGDEALRVRTDEAVQIRSDATVRARSDATARARSDATIPARTDATVQARTDEKG